MKGFGALRFYHYEVEASKGAGMAGSGTCLPLQEFSLLPQWEKDRPMWFTGTGQRDFEIPKRYWVEGSIGCVLYDGIYQDLIELGYARETVANGFDMANSFVILEVQPNETRQYKGILSNRMSIAGSTDTPEVMVTHDCLALSEEADTPIVRGALPSGLPFLFQCATVTWFSGDVSSLATAVEVNIENNLLLNDGPVDCDGTPYYTIGGPRTVNGTLTLLADSAANRVAFRNQTAGSLVLVFTNASVSPTKVITITIPHFTLDQVPEELDPEAVTTEAIPFEAITDSVSGDDIDIAFSTIP